MANGAMVYTTASRTLRKGEIHRGGCGCDARTTFPRRNDKVTARHSRTRGVERTTDAAVVRKSGAANRGSPWGGHGGRTVGWMSLPVPANRDGLTSRLPVRVWWRTFQPVESGLRLWKVTKEPGWPIRGWSEHGVPVTGARSPQVLEVIHVLRRPGVQVEARLARPIGHEGDELPVARPRGTRIRGSRAVDPEEPEARQASVEQVEVVQPRSLGRGSSCSGPDVVGCCFRLRSRERSVMSRVMLCHCQAAEKHALLDENLCFVSCDDCAEMLSEVVQHPPDVVVYEVRPESVSDLAVLRLLRRVAPRVPLVLVGGGRTPAWEFPAELAPLYRSPLPVEERGLRKAVRRALAARAVTAS